MVLLDNLGCLQIRVPWTNRIHRFFASPRFSLSPTVAGGLVLCYQGLLHKSSIAPMPRMRALLYIVAANEICRIEVSQGPPWPTDHTRSLYHFDCSN